MLNRILITSIIIVCLAVFLTPAYGQTDYVLQNYGLYTDYCHYVPPNDPIYTAGVTTIDSMAVLFWKLPPVLRPGMNCKVIVRWKFWTNHIPVCYMNYFGDWQPNTELAQSSMYGGIPSPHQEFTDSFNFLVPSTPGWYRIRFFGRMAYSPVTNFYATPTALPSFFSEIVFRSGFPIGVIQEENNGDVIPHLEKPTNMPNPFRTNTAITYTILKEATVVIKIFDKTGRLVKKAAQGNKSSGHHSFVWDGKDNKGKDLPSGNYFYTVETDKEVLVNKASLVK